MPNAVTDTHALICYPQDDTRLSVAASKYFDQCEYDGGRILAQYLKEPEKEPEIVHSFLHYS